MNDVASQYALEAVVADLPPRRGTGPWLSNWCLRRRYLEISLAEALSNDVVDIGSTFADLDSRCAAIVEEHQAIVEEAKAERLRGQLDAALMADIVFREAYGQRARWASSALSAAHGRLHPFT